MPFRLVWFSRRGRRGGHAHAASPQRCGVNPEALCGVPPVDTEALQMLVVPPKRHRGTPIMRTGIQYPRNFVPLMYLCRHNVGWEFRLGGSDAV